MVGFIQNIIRTRIENIKSKVVQRMGDLNRNASMKSIRSLRVDITDNGGILWGHPSFLTMERGHTPSNGSNFPKGFFYIIRQWIVDKGIKYQPKPYIRPEKGKGYTPEERGLRSLAWAISYNIMQNGTKLWKNQGYDDIYKTATDEELAEMSKEISAFVDTQVTTLNQQLADKYADYNKI